jgi:hypothetical protein
MLRRALDGEFFNNGTTFATIKTVTVISNTRAGHQYEIEILLLGKLVANAIRFENASLDGGRRSSYLYTKIVLQMSEPA